MIKNASLFLLYSITTLSTGMSFAQNNIVTLVSPEIPHLLSAKEELQGPYNQKILQIKAFGVKAFEHRFLPPTRAYMQFDNKNFDCVFPVNNSTLESNRSLLTSEALGVATAYVYTLNINPVIKHNDSLKHIKIGVRRGFDYGGYEFDSSTRKVVVESIEQNIQLLNLQRIDAFIAYEPDSLAIIAKYPNIKVHRDDKFSIYVQKDRIACYDSVDNQQFIADVNKALTQINSVSVGK